MNSSFPQFCYLGRKMEFGKRLRGEIIAGSRLVATRTTIQPFSAFRHVTNA